MNHKTRIPFRATAAAASCFVLTAAVLPIQDSDVIAAARSTLEKWVDTRRVLSAEQRDWQLGREILTSRVDVLQREIDSLQSRVAGATSSIADADKAREALLAEKARLAAGSEVLVAGVAGLEKRTRELLKRVPDPIRERVAPLSQRIPDGTSDSKLGLAERYQNVVGILNEIDKFQGVITLTSEVRTLGDGTTAEVTAIYLGVSQGYYVTANGRHAGVGTGGPDGWTWTAANDAAPRIAGAIAIHKNEGVAEFVPLPMRIQ